METASEDIVVKIKLLNEGSIKAFADISIGGLSIRGFRVVQKAGKDPSVWVAMPSVRYEKNGKWVNKQIVDMTPRFRSLVITLILAEFQKRSSAS